MDMLKRLCIHKLNIFGFAKCFFKNFPLGNKKAMIWKAIGEIALISLALFFVISIFFGGPKGLLNKMASAGTSFADEYLGGLRDEQSGIGEEEIPQNVMTLFDSLSGAFKREGEKCMWSHKWIYNEGLGHYEIYIVGLSDGVEIRVLKEGQILEHKKIEDVYPCIAKVKKEDESSLAEFRIGREGYRFIAEDVKYIQITRTDRINTDIGDYDIEHGRDDFNFLYKPIKENNKGKICFIPTVDGSGVSGGMIGDKTLDSVYIYGMPLCRGG